MKLSIGLGAVAALALLMCPVTASAQSGDGAAHSSSSYYRGKGGAKVRGHVVRRGGYSYSIEDTHNTYGDARTQYGSNSFYRDHSIDRQTDFGPFDNGFFFDQGSTTPGR